MLRVNGSDCKIVETKLKLSKYTINGKKYGYLGFIIVTFVYKDKSGYFDFYLDKTKENDISYYENKKYHCIPEDNDDEINYLEVFDTRQFYDIGEFEKEMIVIFGKFVDNKVKVKIIVDEKNTSILFDDYIKICI